jgi:hypothetical protein
MDFGVVRSGKAMEAGRGAGVSRVARRSTPGHAPQYPGSGAREETISYGAIGGFRRQKKNPNQISKGLRIFRLRGSDGPFYRP